MSEVMDDEALADEARAFLAAAGVRGVSVEGGGESWRVSVGWGADERFVSAYSERNRTTPNDPVYLARQALAALIRNEGPCPFVSHEMLAAEAEAEQDSGHVEETAVPDPEGDGDVLLGAAAPGFAAGEGVEGPRESDAVDQEHQRERDAEEPLQAELADAPEPEHAAYPGITVLEDDLGRRRNQVLAAITARQFLLQDVAADTSRRTFLQQAAADYQNTCFLKIQPTEMQEANYREWMALEARDREVASLASSIARAALSADLDGLERIAAGLEDALR